MCCYVIVTARTLIWSLLSIAATLSMMASLWTPIWLIGPPKKLSKQMATKLANLDYTDELLPSLGLFNRCTKIYHLNRLETECAPFVTGLDQDNNSFPNAWKASLIFLVIGICVMSLTIFSSLLGCCKRSICRKSIFTISGTVQAVAGLFYILGLFSYPFGWGTDRVERVCGQKADPFLLGDCTIGNCSYDHFKANHPLPSLKGWALYLAVGSTVCTFICAILSIQAEISTSSDKVQDEILEGKNLICLL